MRHALALLAAAATLSLVTSCVAPPPARTPAPVEPPPTWPPAPPPPPPASSDWRDWALTPGTWRYAAAPNGSVARFGTAGRDRLTLGCDRAARRIALTSEVAGTMTIRTSSATRSVSGALAASDPLLDAIAFSRGRFIVEQAGAAPLVIPAYAEIGRVIEDCR